jgi:N4-gp56 family major capsid protein
VVYANGAARTSVNTPFTRALQRQALRTIKRNNGLPFNDMVAAQVKFDTHPVEQSYVAICHTDVENDVRNADGFISVKSYMQGNPEAGEIGAIEDCRYFRSTLFTPFADGGGAKAGLNGTCISTTGTSADVYPIIFLAKEAFASVMLRGMSAMSLAILNPKPAPGDPAGQRGSASWKMMMAAGVLNDGWLVRAEVGALA